MKEPINKSHDSPELVELREEVYYWRMHMAGKLIQLERYGVDISDVPTVSSKLLISPSKARLVMAAVPERRAEFDAIAEKYGLREEEKTSAKRNRAIGNIILILVAILLIVMIVL